MTPARSDRLVLVHGFTQTAESWKPFAGLLRERLAPATDIVALDAPGHGALAGVHVDLDVGAATIGRAGGPGTYVGYSMGGRYCLHLALGEPRLVERLVLIGATPGIEDDDERAARRRADEALAQRLERDGLERFLTDWLAQPIFATLPPAAAGIEQRRRNTVEGLASSLRLAGTGTQVSLWPRLGELTMPVLVVAGQLDEKFTAIGRRMAGAMPAATFVAIDGAGHSVHLEQPERAADAIVAWLGADQPPSAKPSVKVAP
jgi:2-succinyl-6-hydroxy-2,4-cyclohexadiene-1-carboxylate synthase